MLPLPDERPSRAPLVAALALLVALVHHASFEVFERPMFSDVRYYVYFAWRVAEGDAPFLDLFDPKTPLATLVGALFVHVGSWLGTEPLFAVRIGYLGLATLGAWLAYFVHRRLGRSAVAGLLGTVFLCAFPLLGEMPAQGNLPKLLMTALAPLAVLAAVRERWILAGVAGALAFLDWQIGVLVLIGVFAVALRHGSPRVGACLRVMLGFLTGLLPVVLYLAAKGALGEAVEQTIVSAFFRGSVTARSWSLAEQLETITAVSVAGAGGRAWLFWTGVAAMPLGPILLWRRWRSDEARLLLPLLVYHFGVLAFSLVDFQSRGDAFVVLNTMGFFLALLGAAGLGLVRRLAGNEERRRVLVSSIAVLAVVIAARPRPLPGDEPPDWRDVRLEDQRDVARRVGELVGERKLAVVEKCELLLLLRRPSPLPFVYWNAAAWGHYRASPEESPATALRRRLNDSDTEALVLVYTQRMKTFGFSHPGPGWTEVRLRSKSGHYGLRVYLREGDS